MENIIKVDSEESQKVLAKEVRALFVQNMKALNHVEIAHGADLLPRSIWSTALALALAERGVIEAKQADAVAVVLNSDLGNSSQLGGALLKEGELKRQTAVQAGMSLADLLAKRAADAKK